MNRFLTASLICLLSVLAPAAAAGDIYLVRHAEKQSGEDPDPGLTQQGLARARDLATLLGSVPVKHIFSSNYRRTRLTAAPLAVARNIDVDLYDPRDLATLVERLHQLQGVALVVGHSNTTPQLVSLLGGDPGPEMTDSDYDRVYLVTLADGGPVETRLFHLPRPSPGGE